ncbi:hypothetical protein GQ600_23484 [Phytophthora cactorum]|nr:hypothetical protein GQ600_23484 [Phytophthora cactorum]
MAAMLKSAEKEMHKSKQRKEELKILYAKFSSTMDSVSDKAMRLEELGQELKKATSEELAKVQTQRYYRAAEDKCRGLLEKVSELESQKASVQKQAKESCTVLRMCVQVDSCDESIRATLLEVVATLDVVNGPGTIRQKEDDDAPVTRMLSDMPVVKRRRLNSPNTDAVVLPDDIGELCSYLDDGDLAEDDVDLLPKQYNDHVQRKRQKIQALKAEKQALRRDLSRSRLVGRNLETDIGRLRRQRQRELSYERRAQRDIHAREEAVTSREQACGDLEETLLQLKAHLLEEIRFQEQSEVKRVVQGLVDHVELSATAIDLQTPQEDLEWSQILEKCWTITQLGWRRNRMKWGNLSL